MLVEDREGKYQSFDYIVRKHFFQLPEIGGFRPAYFSGLRSIDFAQIDDVRVVKDCAFDRYGYFFFLAFFLLKQFVFERIHGSSRFHDHCAFVGYSIENFSATE